MQVPCRVRVLLLRQAFALFVAWLLLATLLQLCACAISSHPPGTASTEHWRDGGTKEEAPSAAEIVEDWHNAPLAHERLFGTRCNLDRIESESEWQRYLAQGRNDPVVLAGLRDNAKFQELCRRSSLLSLYGNTTVTLSSANTHSNGRRDMMFRDYVENEVVPRSLSDDASSTFYFFGYNDYDDWTNFTTQYERAPYTYEREPFFSFGIGGSGSGVPFHTHGAVFAEVIHGAKRWFLAAPSTRPRFDPEETALRWLEYVYPTYTPAERSEILECTLYPNEVLWIDSQWWHMTLNIGDTVFISTFV